MSPYPNAYKIEEIFFDRLNTDRFHEYLADPFEITVAGTDFHIGGSYKTVEDFHDNIYGRINAAIKLESNRVDIRRVIGGGDSAWAAVESHYEFESKEGEAVLDHFSRKRQNLLTQNADQGREYKLDMVDLVRFNSQGKIVQMKEFLDSVAIHNLVEEHEKKTKGEQPATTKADAEGK